MAFDSVFGVRSLPPASGEKSVRFVFRHGAKAEAADRTKLFGILMDSQRPKCYIKCMSEHAESATAARIRKMAQDHQVAYIRTRRDMLARHITRLAGDDVQLDEIEQLLIALQRSGYLSRAEMIQLQANYLREVRS
jgi:hypothetical protein